MIRTSATKPTSVGFFMPVVPLVDIEHVNGAAERALSVPSYVSN